jgi:hypothetical protein
MAQAARALKMAERGLVSAPDMAVGESFNIGITAAQAGATAGVPGLGDLAGNGGTITPGVAQVAAPHAPVTRAES